MPGSPSDLPDGTLENIRQVSFTHDGADFDVSVSPDGQWLVYASTQHRPTADIYMKKVDGNTVTQLTSDPANDTMPAISPDGRTLAFCSNRSGSWDIYLKPIDGGKATQLTSSPSHELHPSFSPDGKRIIFSALGEQSGQWEMVLVDVDRPTSRRFIGYGLFPTFSPDGGKIVFQRARHRGTRWFGVWTMDIHGAEASRPTQIAASTNAAAITPSWSPDGKRIAFATVVNPLRNDPNKRPRNADLWVINVDGTGRVKLTSDKFVNLQPTWCADGWVYFVSNRTGADNIWAVRPDAPTVATDDPTASDATEAAVPVEP
jgi:TolB protein